jgi:hypothetical protein
MREEFIHMGQGKIERTGQQNFILKKGKLAWRETPLRGKGPYLPPPISRKRIKVNPRGQKCGSGGEIWLDPPTGGEYGDFLKGKLVERGMNVSWKESEKLEWMNNSKRISKYKIEGLP